MDAILDATVRILLKRGYQGVTTIAIAERAGVSVGSLYQYFPNKDSLIAALVKRHMEEVARCIDEAFATTERADLEQAVRAIVRAGVKAHRIHPALHRVMTEQAPRIGQMKGAMDTSRIAVRRLAAWLEAHPELGVLDVERTAFIIETVVEALTHRVIVEKMQRMTDDELEDEATRLLLPYLRPHLPCEAESVRSVRR